MLLAILSTCVTAPLDDAGTALADAASSCSLMYFGTAACMAKFDKANELELENVVVISVN